MTTSVTEDEIYYNVLNQPIGYEGASTRYRSDQRGLLNESADSIAVRELLLLQMRSAHAIRNNGYAKTALTKYVTALNAIEVKWKNEGKKTENKAMQALWDEFAANPNVDNVGTLANTQSLWGAARFVDGSAHTQMLVKKKNNSNTVPLKLKVIPTQMHDIGYNGKSVNDGIKNGIKFDTDGVPVSYYYREDLYEHYWYGKQLKFEPTQVPAEDVLHIFERVYPGQWIGVPILSSILVSLYELDELVDATVAKQKAAQAISWIVENTNPGNMLAVGSPTTVRDKDESGVPKNKIVFKTQGGNVQYMNKGEKIHFYQSTDIGANLTSLIGSELHKIAAALDIPYHSLTGDTSGLDFSSIRAIGIELRLRLEYIHHFLTIPLGLSPLCAKFKAYAIPYNKRLASAIPTFQLPRWYGVDELKDAQADALELQMGMTTLERILQERHVTFEEVVEDAKRNEELKKHGIDIYGSKNKSMNQVGNKEANSNSSSN
jgi:lambda family phage portal protein